MTEPDGPQANRHFITGPDGEVRVVSDHERLRLAGISGAVSAAYDIMRDDGVPAEQAAEYAMAAEQLGQDPEAFARRVCRLRRTVREHDSFR